MSIKMVKIGLLSFLLISANSLNAVSYLETLKQFEYGKSLTLILDKLPGYSFSQRITKELCQKYPTQFVIGSAVVGSICLASTAYFIWNRFKSRPVVQPKQQEAPVKATKTVTPEDVPGSQVSNLTNRRGSFSKNATIDLAQNAAKLSKSKSCSDLNNTTVHDDELLAQNAVNAEDQALDQTLFATLAALEAAKSK